MRHDVHLEPEDIIVLTGTELEGEELDALAAETGRLVVALTEGQTLSTVTRDELVMFLRAYDEHEAEKRRLYE